MPKTTCRLYVILARSAPVAVIFRRGPARRVQLVKWSTDNDTFEEGQWFHGRVYERRCDLSPDGSRLVYFAQKINARTMESDYTYAWTAISKPPFYTALALWPKGDCWNGGGLFQNSNHILLNHPVSAAAPHPEHKPARALRVTPDSFARGEDAPILSARRVRDGWKLVQAGQYPWKGDKPQTKQREVWQRRCPVSPTSLLESLDKLDFKAHGGPYIVSYSLDRRDRSSVDIRGAQWADWDQSGRLVFARDGCLFSGIVEGDELRETLLVDLNPNKPRPLEAPRWAAIW